MEKEIDIDRIIEDLLGTCKSLVSVLDSYGLTEDDLSDKERFLMDNEIFLCDECGWWMEISQCTEDGICEDCNPDNEYNEEE